MHICLDIDDTITYAPELFRVLLEALPEAKITVVTFRTNYDDAATTLAEHGIRYDELIVSSDPERGRSDDQLLTDWKAQLVNQLSPDWFFEDMPEVIGRIDSHIAVFMPCDDVIRGWLRSASS